MMSINFYGWEVDYDSNRHLNAEQKPEPGKNYIMYHGTTVQAARTIIQNGFCRSIDGMLGPGVYVSRNRKKAERYPLNSSLIDRVVLKLSVDTGNVFRIDRDNHPMQKTWHQNGFDTAWVPPNCGMRAVRSGLTEDCVWDPKRIEVTDVVVAPNTDTLVELKQLIIQKSPQGAATVSGVCKLCNSVIVPEHSTRTCWGGCGDTICTLMPNHQCRRWQFSPQFSS